jgi:hypothetical protein
MDSLGTRADPPPPKPDTSFEAVRKRLGTKPGTLAAFEAEYSPVRPPDGDQALRFPKSAPIAQLDRATPS